VPGRLGNRHPSITPYETYRAADADFAVACGNDALFRRLCGAVERPGLADDARFATNRARLEHRDDLTAELEAAFAEAGAEEWVARLAAAGVPAGPINDVGEAFAFAEALGLDPWVDVDGVRTVRPVTTLSETPASVRRRPPRLGEHDAGIRAWLADG
jgi:formyl-CoA transferase